MAKFPKCWAACLDDCSGGPTVEHLIPLSLWESNDRSKTRKQRLKIPVRSGGSALGGVPAGNLTAGNIQAGILCRAHNNATGVLDQEGQKLAAVLEMFWGMNVFAGTPIAIPPHQFDINGPLLERFLLKVAINFCVNVTNKLPIGSPDAQPGYPTDELVEMVFGRHPVVPPRGLWACPIAEHPIVVRDEFHVTPVNPSGYFVGALIEFRRLNLVANFEDAQLAPFPEPHGPERHPFNGLVPFQPVNEFVNKAGSMRVVFHWPSVSADSSVPAWHRVGQQP